ncbi:MAG: nucleotidyltransferase domain-containing protein [Thiohalocapsa sp.]|nr:nucleotidyltransferase domain-containing protein [Thiohalocapsa sp.]
MRLDQTQLTAIRHVATECFGDDARLWLFGSRVDDAARGGDIDLLVEIPSLDSEQALRAKYDFLALLKQRIGDRRVDVVLSTAGSANPPDIVEIAKQTGVRL